MFSCLWLSACKSSEIKFVNKTESDRQRSNMLMLRRPCSAAGKVSGANEDITRNWMKLLRCMHSADGEASIVLLVQWTSAINNWSGIRIDFQHILKSIPKRKNTAKSRIAGWTWYKFSGIIIIIPGMQSLNSGRLRLLWMFAIFGGSDLIKLNVNFNWTLFFSIK